MIRTRRSILTRVGLSVYLALLALALIELGLRRFDPQIAQSAQLFESNPARGWQFVPGLAARTVFPSDHRGFVRINSAGLRDRERDPVKPPGTCRVLVLGDEFTSGLDVDARDVFTVVMEDALSRGVEVLNFGINGFGPTQECSLLEEQGLAYAPDCVLMVVNLGDDLDVILGSSEWGAGYRRPRAVLKADGGVTILAPMPAPERAQPRPTPSPAGSRRSAPAPASRFGPSSWHLAALIRARLAELAPSDRNQAESRFASLDSTGAARQAFDLFRGVLRRTRDLARANGATFGVVLAPARWQVYPGQDKKSFDRSDPSSKSSFDLDRPNKILAGICADLGIPVRDLTPALRAAAVRGPALYYDRDHDWNRAGHRAVAVEVMRFLHEQGWIPIAQAALDGGVETPALTGRF